MKIITQIIVVQMRNTIEKVNVFNALDTYTNASLKEFLEYLLLETNIWLLVILSSMAIIFQNKL